MLSLDRQAGKNFPEMGKHETIAGKGRLHPLLAVYTALSAP